MTIQLLLIATLCTGAAWKIADLTLGRRGNGPFLHWIIAIFLLLALGNILSLPGPLHWLDQLLFVGVGRLIFNAVIVSGLCAVVCLGLVTTRRRRRLPFEVAACAAVIAGLAIVTALIPQNHRGHSLTSHDLADPRVTTFYVIGNLYFVYAYTTAARRISHFSRYGVAASRLGLRVLAVGLGGLGITCLLRLVWIFAPALRETSPGRTINAWNFSVANWATIAVCVGLCLPALAQTLGALRLRHLRRNQMNSLHPLWERLAQAFPELLFDSANRRSAGATERRTRRRATSIQWRLYRRYVECRDGLLRLSPYLAEVASSMGEDVEALDATGIAALIDRALDLKPLDELEENPLLARKIATSSGNGFDEDLSTVIAISEALPARRAKVPSTVS